MRKTPMEGFDWIFQEVKYTNNIKSFTILTNYNVITAKML